jgi:hypothetical protein
MSRRSDRSGLPVFAPLCAGNCSFLSPPTAFRESDRGISAFWDSLTFFLTKNPGAPSLISMRYKEKRFEREKRWRALNRHHNTPPWIRRLYRRDHKHFPGSNASSGSTGNCNDHGRVRNGRLSYRQTRTVLSVPGPADRSGMGTFRPFLQRSRKIDRSGFQIYHLHPGPSRSSGDTRSAAGAVVKGPSG